MNESDNKLFIMEKSYLFTIWDSKTGEVVEQGSAKEVWTKVGMFRNELLLKSVMLKEGKENNELHSDN